MTDGEPEGKDALENMTTAIQQTIELERNNKLVVFNIGIGSDANLDILSRLSIKREAPISADITNLDKIFQFIGSSSDTIVSGGNVDDIYVDTDNIDKGEEIDISQWCI